MTSATNELRHLLDERGVEHYDGTERTLWGYEQTGEDTGIYRFAASEISGGFLQFDMFRITPEQAIAATLGDVPRLPYFWTADGTLHIELPKLPESISVRLPDQRDREVGSARTWQYMQDSGTCRYEIAFFGDSKAWFACSECGGMASADYDPPKYCPHCGRKVVDE